MARPTFESLKIRPQVGQELSVGASGSRFSDDKIRRPASTSLTGSAVSDTRMVSPIPRSRSEPIPMADFITPICSVPASVTPRCKG